MDFKKAVIENAWGGFNVDYGMLHFQLATPAFVLIVILIMIFTLNRLLFKPVLRTIDNRKETIEKSKNKVLQASEEFEKLETEFQQKLEGVRSEVLHLLNSGHEEGIQKRESIITEKRSELQIELDKNINELSGEIKETKIKFAKLNQDLSVSISKRLLN